MTAVYRIAELNIEISSVYDEVHRLCRDYLVAENIPDLCVMTTQESIDYERERSERTDETERRQIISYKDGYLETLAVYRKIAEIMPQYDTMLCHGSCVAVDNEGYLFVAKSGTGKSTHTMQWRKLLGDRAVMVNDDKPLIRVGDKQTVVFGTPWDGKHRLSSNISVPLKAVCILGRAEKNEIQPVTPLESYPILLQQIYRPSDIEAMRRTLFMIDKLASSVDLWRMGCNMDVEAAKIAYEAMKG